MKDKIHVLPEKKGKSVARQLAGVLSKLSLDKRVKDEVKAVAGKVTEGDAQLSEVLICQLVDFAQACQRVWDMQGLSDDLKHHDPEMYLKVIAKLQNEIALKQRLLKSLGIINQSSGDTGYKKKPKPDSGQNWSGVL